mmetsp:Transcript_14199/g.33925  ORF Transcript_14199/g.33925 Transcript_14199/m.33925 type:complete len:95 (+) Transcript_14199:1099-1383(+)
MTQSVHPPLWRERSSADEERRNEGAAGKSAAPAADADANAKTCISFILGTVCGTRSGLAPGAGLAYPRQHQEIVTELHQKGRHGGRRGPTLSSQ